MKLFEYMGKDLYRKYGILVPEGRVVQTPDDAASAAEAIGPMVLKSQVLTGKRGKAGGIAFVDNSETARQEAKRLLEMQIDCFKVEKLLAEKKIKIERELYLAISIDGAKRCSVVLASLKGGMDIEEVPEELIVNYPVNIGLGMQPFMTREICRRLTLKGEQARVFSSILLNLYRLFKEMDAELVEINPLAICGDKMLAADAKLTIDDDALFRHTQLPLVEERTDLEKKAHELGLVYVELDGDIAVMANGAGMAMATLDMLEYYGGKPANFLDAGGGAGVEQTARALEMLLATRPKVIMINIFGGITRCDDVAAAFASVKKERGLDVPVVFRLVGTNENEGRKILESIGIRAYRTIQETAQKAVELSQQSA